MKIITGCSAPTLAGSIAYAREAERNGADALLSMPQTYVLQSTRDEVVRRFEGLAHGVSLPIVAYNSPRRVGFSMMIGDINAIMNVAPIIGIKESERDFFHHTHLIKNFRDRMSIMVGPCHYIFPGLAIGAHGFIATGPEFLGGDTARLASLAREKPTAETATLHYKLTVLYGLLLGTATWPAAFKAALNLIGLPVGVPRDPVAPAAAADIAKIRRTFEKLELAGGWRPTIDVDGATSVPLLWCSGDGAGVLGVDAALAGGALGGLSAAEALGATDKMGRVVRRGALLKQLEAARRFGAAMGTLTAFRPGLFELATPETTVCRCESISRREIEAEVASGAESPNALKSGTRAGMGPCGGRYCGETTALIVAKKTGRSREEISLPTARPPLKPVPLVALAGNFKYESLPIPGLAPL